MYWGVRGIKPESERSCICVLEVLSQESEQSCICVLEVSSQESERSCICVLEVSILPLSTIFLLDFGAVLTVWYVLFLLNCIIVLAI